MASHSFHVLTSFLTQLNVHGLSLSSVIHTISSLLSSSITDTQLAKPHSWLDQALPLPLTFICRNGSGWSQLKSMTFNLKSALNATWSGNLNGMLPKSILSSTALVYLITLSLSWKLQHVITSLFASAHWLCFLFHQENRDNQKTTPQTQTTTWTCLHVLCHPFGCGWTTYSDAPICAWDPILYHLLKSTIPANAPLRHYHISPLYWIIPLTEKHSIISPI